MGEALGICPSGPWHGRQRRADAPSPSPAAPTSLPKRIAPRGASAAPGRSGRRPFYPTGAALRVPIAPTLASAVSAGRRPAGRGPPRAHRPPAVPGRAHAQTASWTRGPHRRQQAYGSLLLPKTNEDTRAHTPGDQVPCLPTGLLHLAQRPPLPSTVPKGKESSSLFTAA